MSARAAPGESGAAPPAVDRYEIITPNVVCEIGQEEDVRAIVIDDSVAIRRILKNMLTEIGFEAVEAKNGRDALVQMRAAGKVDLALVDWIMPDMSGLEFVRAARADHAYDDMRIMMVTSESETTNVAAALQAGADEYVMKPFTKDVILEKLSLLGIEQP